MIQGLIGSASIQVISDPSNKLQWLVQRIWPVSLVLVLFYKLFAWFVPYYKKKPMFHNIHSPIHILNENVLSFSRMGPLLREKWHVLEYGLSVLILVIIKGPGDMTMVTAIYSNTGSDVFCACAHELL